MAIWGADPSVDATDLVRHTRNGLTCGARSSHSARLGPIFSMGRSTLAALPPAARRQFPRRLALRSGLGRRCRR